jgi:hypothetical protein
MILLDFDSCTSDPSLKIAFSDEARPGTSPNKSTPNHARDPEPQIPRIDTQPQIPRINTEAELSAATDPTD